MTIPPDAPDATADSTPTPPPTAPSPSNPPATRATPRGPALSTVLFAAVLLLFAGSVLSWQLWGELPVEQVSGTGLLFGVGAVLVVIGGLASLARSRE